MTIKETKSKPKQRKTKEDELPIIQSVTLQRVEGGLWTCLTIFSQGDKIVNVTNTTPSTYNSAINDAKIKFIQVIKHY